MSDDAAAADSLLVDIESWTAQLAGTSLVTSLMAVGGELPDRPTHLNCLGALAIGELTLARARGATPAELERLAQHIDVATRAALASNKVAHVDELDPTSERVSELLRVIDGYHALTGQSVRTSL